ncbi:unnamed protein product [Parnassius mnemosyne]|uniref:Reverse transcriptase Ty1/copia-type domain-containing protein n=1 Tax=Parnassius mnemosyne TaxID=213953 RepID=A0AAV1L3W1_9NEOP
MSANKVVNGLEIIDNGQNNFVCEACAYGKQCKFPFHKSERGELQPGYLVYNDVCAPMSILSIQVILDDEVTNVNESEAQESNVDDTLVESQLTESEDSMLSCTGDDSDCEPSRELQDSTIHTKSLRPRINRNYEANLVELSLPQTYAEALNSPQKAVWYKAIREEKSGQRNLSTKWVFTIKKNENNQIARYKACLCARGFNQIKDIDYQEIFSPTTRYNSIRIILSVAAKYNLKIQQFHVKTAFLNRYLEEDIFINIPEGLSIKSDLVLKLINHCMV